MTQRPPTTAILKAAMDRLMPLHLLLVAKGRITGCGPTLAKLPGGGDLIGRSLFAAFDLRRPAGMATMSDLRAHQGEKLRLMLRGQALRGLAVSTGKGMMINLSFGIGVVDAVRANDLTDGDFAPTDLAIEMMYLVEAKAAAMNALRGLAQRLEGDKQQAQAQALTDTLTGLRNRRALSLALDKLMRAQTSFALMHIDLDFFKSVNDTLGHAAGDHVLQVVAEVLQRETRGQDTVARVGGDEFVVVFSDMTERSRLEGIARRIIAELSKPMDFMGQACRISASIGITMSTHYEQPDADRMQTDADEALYASKRAGRGQAQFYKPDGDRRRA